MDQLISWLVEYSVGQAIDEVDQKTFWLKSPRQNFSIVEEWGVRHILFLLAGSRHTF